MRSFAIIPAAGLSVRMGEPKLLMPWGQMRVIERVLATWRASQVSQVVVVVRGDDPVLARSCRESGAQVVVPQTPPAEMKISVCEALLHIQRHFAPGSADVWLLAPADMPRLSALVIDQLLAAHDAARPAILVPAIDGRCGHPILLPWPVACHAHRIPASEGINSLLKRHPVRQVSCGDPAILDDMDTPADYHRLRGPRE